MKTKQWDLSLNPIHYACLSGGKDSLYMLGVILKNPNKYPLDYVLNYDLEIDWKWVKHSVNKIEQMCIKAKIPFLRIKPRRKWLDLYEKYDMPTRRARWCNNLYKLDCEKQMIEWIKKQNCRPIAYIGFCLDEERRFKYQLGNWEKGNCCYPLAEEGITEDTILEWAKKQTIFSNWYKHFKRQGCMLCPMLTMKELAYLYKYENENFEKYFEYVKAYENKFNTFFWNRPCEKVRERVIGKWLNVLEEEEK